MMISMSEKPAETIHHRFKDVDYDIPADLLAIQRRYDQADADCRRLAMNDSEADAYDEARARRLQAVLDKHRHPWMDGGRNHSGDAALKDVARQASADV